MNFIASLPWYDFPEVRTATDALWRCIRGHLLAQGQERVPEQLVRSLEPACQWSSPELLLTQACGYDAVLSSRDVLRLVATPSFTLKECKPGYYRSLIIVEEDSCYQALSDLRGTRCAINSPTSHSGMNSLRAMVAGLHREGRFFQEILVSGRHRDSLSLLRQGLVDVAAIDIVSFRLLQRHCPELTSRTRVLAVTEQAPAPPYVTSQRASTRQVERLRHALTLSFNDPSIAWARELLLLDGLEFFELSEYQIICELQAQALESIGTAKSWPRLLVGEQVAS